MFILLITVCASVAMDDCQVQQMGHFRDALACQVAYQRAEIVLGRGPDQNYRLECVKGEQV